MQAEIVFYQTQLGTVARGKETIGLHAGNLETRLEELLEERREQLRERE